MIKENIIFALRLNVRLNKAHQKHPAEILINRLFNLFRLQIYEISLQEYYYFKNYQI